MVKYKEMFWTCVALNITKNSLKILFLRESEFYEACIASDWGKIWNDIKHSNVSKHITFERLILDFRIK